MKKFCKRADLALILIFLYLPIVVLIVQSFNAGKSRAKWEGFSFHWYEQLFSNSSIMSALWVTVSIAVIATIAATILGTLAAIGIYSMKKRPQSLMMTLTNLPNTMPDIVTGISLMLLFILLKMELGFSTLILAHITFNVPIVIFNVLPKLRQMDKNVYNAALDLGCNPAQAFAKVVLPEIMPGIAAGFLLSVTYSFDDFAVSYFTSGSSSQTLSVVIYSMVKMKVSPEINALSTIMFAFVLIVLLLVNIYGSKNKNKKQEGEA